MDKKISGSKILNECFNIYIGNFIKLSLPMAIYSTIFYLVLNKIPLFTQGYGLVELHEYTNIGFLLNTCINAYLTCVVIKIVSSIYTGTDNKYIENFKVPIRIIVGLILFNYIYAFSVGIGIVLLVFPGIWVALGWIVTQSVYLNEEDENMISSIGRSWDLTKGNKGQIFGVKVIMGILIIIFILVLYYLIQGSMLTFTSVRDGSFTLFAKNPIYLIIYNSLLIPITVSLNAIIYFNLKKVKEGFEVEQLTNNFMDGDNES